MTSFRRCICRLQTSTRAFSVTSNLSTEAVEISRTEQRRPDERRTRRAPSGSMRRERQQRYPSDSQSVLIKFHGTSGTWQDIQPLLRDGKEEGPVPVDYTLRRARQTSTTQIQAQFSSPEEVERVRKALRSGSINGAPVRAHTLHQNEGLLGKYEPLHASPQSGPGRVVSVEGLPYMCNEAYLRRAFSGYELVDNPEFQFHLVKKAHNRSVWLVRTKSEDEAQRIVRSVNSTYYKFDEWGTDYPLKAEVFY